MSKVTPDSLQATTENANIVIQHSVTELAVRFWRSTRKRSPERVEIELVGSAGTFRTSKQMVKVPVLAALEVN